MTIPLFKPLRAFCDDRGYSYHKIFSGLDGGQINIGVLEPGLVKAFHFHKLQWDHWYGLSGDMHVVVAKPKDEYLKQIRSFGDNPDEYFLDQENMNKWQDPNSPFMEIYHFYIGEHNPGVISIPPNWWHGYSTLGTKPSTLLYWVTKEYNPEDPDEFRVSWNIFGEDFWKPRNK